VKYGEEHWKKRNWEMHTVGLEFMARNNQKLGKWDTNTVWPGIWLERLKKVENEKYTLYALEYGTETENHGKWGTYIVGSEIC